METIQSWLPTLLTLVPGGLFTAWCLWCVNWRKTWPALAAGGWIAVVLIALMGAALSALVWPSQRFVLGMVTVPNGLWQLGSAFVLLCVALFCGWLQGRLQIEPMDINFDPPPVSHDAHHHH